MLQVPQLRLLGELVLELSWLTVLVSGRELEGGDCLSRVLIQDEPLVSNDRGGKSVL